MSKLLPGLILALLSACAGRGVITQPVVPDAAPLRTMIDSCEPSGVDVICPKPVFVDGMEAATRHYEAAVHWQAEHQAVFDLWGLDQESMEALRDAEEKARKARYYWGAGGFVSGAVTILVVLLAT